MCWSFLGLLRQIGVVLVAKCFAARTFLAKYEPRLPSIMFAMRDWKQHKNPNREWIKTSVVDVISGQSCSVLSYQVFSGLQELVGVFSVSRNIDEYCAAELGPSCSSFVPAWPHHFFFFFKLIISQRPSLPRCSTLLMSDVSGESAGLAPLLLHE